MVKTIAKVEGLVYNAAKSLTEALSVGPTWIKRVVSKVTNVIFDALMSSSRLKLGLGLLALGALSNDSGLRTEGRLELLTASLYFNRMSGAIPQWLLIIVMVVLSMFFPFIAIVIAFAMIASVALMKWQLPKLENDPDAMLRHLFMLRKYGLLDEETAALLDLFADRSHRHDLYDDTSFGGYVGGYEYETVELHNLIANIRDMLKDHDTELQDDFVPGNVIPPSAIQKGGADTSSMMLFMISAIAMIAVARLV